jgi:hypothetical protein
VRRGLTLLTAAAILLLGCASQEDRARKFRLASRELTIPARLRNDRLLVHNDELRDDIARLEHRPADPERLAIDRFVLEQDKAAGEIANHFARAWSDDGKAETRSRLAAIETQFDTASEECDKRAAAATTIPDAQVGCAAFLHIRSMAAQVALE